LLFQVGPGGGFGLVPVGFDGGFFLFLGQGIVGRYFLKEGHAFLVAGFPVSLVLLPLVFVKGDEVGLLGVGQLGVGGQALGQKDPAFFRLFRGEGRVFPVLGFPVGLNRGLFFLGRLALEGVAKSLVFRNLLLAVSLPRRLLLSAKGLPIGSTLARLCC
jgi:hypothetical protein